MASIELIHGIAKPTVLRDVMKDAKEIIVISAYTTAKGLAEIEGPLLACAGRSGTVTLMLGVDRAVASAELIRALGALLGKAKGRLRVVLVVEAGKTFLHAKVFAARKQHGADILIGSFNLTGRGLQGNHELAARLTGNSHTFFADLRGFIASIPKGDRHELTADNVDPLARALAPPTHGPGTEDVARRREEAAARLEAILKALRRNPARPGEAPTSDPALDVARVVQEGAFFQYQVDLDKLSIPSGLQRIYDAGLLSKQARERAGVFDVKQTNALTASVQLLPPDLRKAFRALSTRLGKALGAFGFETPFGYWVPRPLQPAMRDRVARLAAAAPSGPKVEQEVRRFVARQLAEFDGSTRKLLDRVARSGLQRPALWREVREPALKRIKATMAGATDQAWRGSRDERQALGWVEAHLAQAKAKLDADVTVAKLRRVRPEVVEMPVDATTLKDTEVHRVLECIAWAVAEGRAQRRNRPILKPLLARVHGDAKQVFEQMQALSDALIVGLPDAERAFIAAFGSPPYWSGYVPGPADEELDDAGEFDDDDE